MYEMWNQDTLMWEVQDLVFGGVLFAHKDRQECINYIESHQDDVVVYEFSC